MSLRSRVTGIEQRADEFEVDLRDLDEATEERLRRLEERLAKLETPPKPKPKPRIASAASAAKRKSTRKS